jgi:hypothetical protein
VNVPALKPIMNATEIGGEITILAVARNSLVIAVDRTEK